jgi:hypothetical protein
LLVHTCFQLIGKQMAHASTRGSRPGERRGGRPKGGLNKRTLALRQGLVTVGAMPEEAALPPALLPLQLMLDVVRDENLPLEVRLNAARWAAPYCHHHKGQVDVNGINLWLCKSCDSVPKRASRSL